MAKQGLLARVRARFRNPFRTMYGSGHEPGANPSMAAAARHAPEATAHGSLGADDGDRSFGGSGVFGLERPQSERRSNA